MACYCENSHCDVCRARGCHNPASKTVTCMYIGNICDPCASFMPGEYLTRTPEWVHPSDEYEIYGEDEF